MLVIMLTYVRDDYVKVGYPYLTINFVMFDV